MYIIEMASAEVKAEDIGDEFSQVNYRDPGNMNTTLAINMSRNLSGYYKSISYYADPSVPKICTVFMIAICFLGIIGNTLSFFALKHSSQRSSSNTYLRALAIADTLTLLFSSIPLLFSMVGRPLLTESSWIVRHLVLQDGVCQVRIFLSYFTRTVSCYIIVLFTIERCITLTGHLGRQYVSRAIQSAFKRLGILLVFSLLCNIPAFFSTRMIKKPNGDEACRVNKLFFSYAMGIYICVNLLPSFVIVASNASIVFLMHARRMEAKHLRNPNEYLVKRKQEIRSTRRLLLVSTTFVLLGLPLLICSTINAVFSWMGERGRIYTRGSANAILISLTLHSVNFACNFVIYYSSGKHFRRVVFLLLTCNRQQLARYDHSMRSSRRTPSQSPRISTNQSVHFFRPTSYEMEPLTRQSTLLAHERKDSQIRSL